LNRTLKTSHIETTKQAIGHGGLFGSFFLLYGYSFFFGGVLRWNKVEAGTGLIYTGGVIIGCLFCVVFGTIQFGGASPHLTAVS
jgi:hypothetical protein